MDRWLSGVKRKAILTSEEGQNEKKKERLVESTQVSTYHLDLRVSDQKTTLTQSVCYARRC